MDIKKHIVELFVEANGKNLPFRNRVEVFAIKDGKVYGGLYPDGSFGVFGGGTDSDTIKVAARREYREESGYSIKKLKKLDISPVEILWKKEHKTKQNSDRYDNYKGTRTWYFVAELGSKGSKAKGDDGKSSLTQVRLYSVEEAIKALKKKGHKYSQKQLNARKKALSIIQEMANEK